MSQPFVRSALASLLVSSGLALSIVPVPVLAQDTVSSEKAVVEFSIPAQPLASALILFSQQAGVQVSMQGQLGNGVQSAAVSGTHDAESGIALLLQGTGFTHSRTGPNTFTVQAPGGQDPNAAAAPASEVAGAGEAVAATVEATKRGGIEEIIVTARKREESVQDIPISVTAITEEDLKSFGVRNVADMEGIVPGLNMGGGGNGVKKDSNPYIRGVGQRETKVTLDPAVGTYIDGIYIARTAGALVDTVGVESIEVLRGPQGTLFGRNSTGGAISITTKKPSNEWGAKLGTNVGNYGRHDVTLALNAPLIKDKLLGRLTLASINGNGYFENIVDNTYWNDDNRIVGIGQLRWVASDDVTVDFLGERTRIRERPRPQSCHFIREPGFQTAHTGQLNSLRSYGRPEVGLDRQDTFEELCRKSQARSKDRFDSNMAVGDDLLEQGRYFVDTTTLGGTANWEVGDAGVFSGLSAKSITAWRKVDQIADEDLDGVGAPYLVRVQPEATETTQFSQELQLSGKTVDDRLFFSTGLYYFTEETPKDDLILSAGVAQSLDNGGGPFAGNPLTIALEPAKERLETDNEAYAWFGQVDFDMTPEFQATAGLRYTEEERWSRYSKGIVTADSIARGNTLDTRVNQFSGTYFVISDQLGFNPVATWRFNPLVGDELTHKDEAWTPMASLKYRAGPGMLDALGLNHAMAYATYSVGYHAGGVTSGALDNNANGTGDPIEFKPETVKNYELGLKLAALDRRVQANLAVFYMDYTDMQITSTASRFGIPVPFIENVGKAVIKGVEAEFVMQPLPDWRIVFNSAYTDADIKEWHATDAFINFLTGLPIPCPNPDGCFIERDDEPMPRVPRMQAFLMTDYAMALKGGSTLTPSVAVRYVSEIYHGFDRGSYCFTYGGVCDRGDGPFGGGPLDIPNDAVIVPQPGARGAVTSDKTAFLDARLAWVSADSKMEVALWGKNLTNVDDYMVGGIPLVDVTGGTGVIYANPRTFGLNMTYTFGAQ